MNPLISIQILNWNRADDTQRAIRSAMKQTYDNLEIVVIDNGSTDHSVKLTKENFPQIKIIELEKNYGCPGGRNMGIQYCNGEYIFYLDNDGILHKDAVKNAYESITAFPGTGIVTGVVYEFSSPSEINPNCAIRSNVKYFYNDFQGGICMHDKKIYAKTGLYPAHFIYGAEEYYMSLKVFENDFSIIKDESVILWHKQSNIARNRSQELTSRFFNKLYTCITLYPNINAIQFAIYFVPVYIKHAYNHGILLYFLKKLPRAYLRNIWLALKNRNPISKTAYKRFHSNERVYVKQPDNKLTFSF
ncbi:MAG: glycosyltransferase [Chitinophagaceae bacterium]|nr:glycosyltransferase [Chitinophagaceae bacterium]